MDAPKTDFWEIGKRIDTAYQSFFSMFNYTSEEPQTSFVQNSPTLSVQEKVHGHFLGLPDEIWEQILRVVEPRSILQGLMYEYAYHYIESYRSFLLVNRRSYSLAKGKLDTIFQKYGAKGITSLTYNIKDKPPIIPYEKTAITYFLKELESRKLSPEMNFIGLARRDFQIFSAHLNWVLTLNIGSAGPLFIMPVVKFLKSNTTLLTLDLSIVMDWKEWSFIDHRYMENLLYLSKDNRLRNLCVAGNVIKGKVKGEQIDRIPEILEYHQPEDINRDANHRFTDLVAFLGGAHTLEGTGLTELGEE